MAATRASGLWRPADEAMATGTMTVFVEWLRATGLCPDAAPIGMAAWLVRDTGTLETIARFAGLDPGDEPAGWLRHDHGDRKAVIRRMPDGSDRTWSYAELARSDTAWRAASFSIAFARPTLLHAIAVRLLVLDTRPDDRIDWAGDPADPLAWASLAAGATLVLAPETAGDCHGD